MSKKALQNKMFQELGFKNLAHFRAKRRMAVSTRYHIYEFSWRLIMRKYQSKNVVSLIDWSALEHFHTEYEDYVLKNYRGSLKNWSKAAQNQYDYLTKKLIRRWTIIKHSNRFFTIIDPGGVTWFRALDMDELFKALQICFLKGKGPTRRKVYTHGLKWNDCVAGYNSRIKRGRSYWARVDLDISLIIAAKIIRTFDSKTGLWQTGGYKWALIVLKKLTLNNKTSFDDIVNIVSAASLTSVHRGVYAIALFWGVGGNKAVNVIKGAYKRNNIPAWWH